MNPDQKKIILSKAQKWFGDKIVANHIKKTTYIIKHPSKLNINPFTVRYLAKFIGGTVTPDTLARAVIYPRVIGTSIGTIFGTHAQSFISDVLGGLGSTTSGIDIEFTDHVDESYKYCQVKAGPDTINKDDVKTIDDHFSAIKRLAATNKRKISINDMVIGILYGEDNDINPNYRALRDKHHYRIYVGKDFWHRLT